MLYYIDKNWYHFIKEYLEQISKFAFKKLFTQSGDQADIFWKFYLPADTLWLPKTVGQVLGYTTEETFWWLLLMTASASDFSFMIFYWFLPPN